MKKLEELLNLPPKPGPDIEDDVEESTSHDLVEADPNTTITLEEKIDQALTAVSNLDEHADESDRIAREALESYEEFKQFGLNSSDIHAAKILDTATSMLRLALEARNSKAERRMKTLDLQLKRLKAEQQKSSGKPSGATTGGEYDRNHLLRLMAADATPSEDT